MKIGAVKLLTFWVNKHFFVKKQKQCASRMVRNLTRGLRRRLCQESASLASMRTYFIPRDPCFKKFRHDGTHLKWRYGIWEKDDLWCSLKNQHCLLGKLQTNYRLDYNKTKQNKWLSINKYNVTKYSIMISSPSCGLHVHVQTCANHYASDQTQ